MPVPDPLPLLAYGPAPGIELIPYFLGLLAWIGLALAAVVASPFRTLYRRLRGGGPPVEAPPPPPPEPTGDRAPPPA